MKLIVHTLAALLIMFVVAALTALSIEAGRERAALRQGCGCVESGTCPCGPGCKCNGCGRGY